MNSIAKELHASVIFANSAAEIWVEYRNQFQQGNGPRIFQLNKEVLNSTQGTLSVSAYFSKFKCLWDSLAEHNPPNTCNCGGSDALVAYLKRQHVLIFLMGLNRLAMLGDKLIHSLISAKSSHLLYKLKTERNTTTEMSSQMAYVVNN